jgi:RNA polymerase sigma factor (TIGR02999 family)
MGKTDMARGSSANSTSTPVPLEGSAAPDSPPRAIPSVSSDGYAALLRMSRAVHRRCPSWTLNPTALLHEALIKIHSWPKLPVSDDPHFMALTARAMRQLLVDEVRKKAQSKRGGGLKFVPLTDGARETTLSPAEFLDLNRALDELAEMNARHALAIEYTAFFGYTVEEAAALLKVSAKTVERDLRAANAWLASKVTAGVGETGRSETQQPQRAVK